MNTTTVDSTKSFEIGVTTFLENKKKNAIEYDVGQEGKGARKVDIEIGTELVSIPAGDISVDELNLSTKELAQLKANRENAKTTERWQKVHGNDIELGD